ncbi:MAG: DUF3817 domain-containing protein [Bacteroidota bacterium]
MEKQAGLLRNFFWLAYAEGVSFIALLGIAMPLKYLWNMPEYVRVTGMIHGVLFVLYVMMLAYIAVTLSWNFKKVAWGLLASVLPFGPFFLHRVLQDN